LLGDHPLVGTVWDVRSGERIDTLELARRARAARFVLLGEKHDNPDHHRLQAWVLEQVVKEGRRPTVAFEMIRTDSEESLRAHLADHPRDVDGVASAVGWETSGWPDWKFYRPIFAVALENGLEIVAANLSPSDVRRVSSEGLGALPEEMRRRTGLDEELAPELHEGLAEEIRAGHCGVLPEKAVRAMIRVQRARDGQMADRLLEPPREDGAVLIAGAGHVIRSRAVPAMLERHVPAGAVFTVGFYEVTRGEKEPYLPISENDGKPEFDVVWLTPRVDEADPCEKFKERLEQLRQQHEGKPEPD
jgi:uncharacterized iron-regulated protein